MKKIALKMLDTLNTGKQSEPMCVNLIWEKSPQSDTDLEFQPTSADPGAP